MKSQFRINSKLIPKRYPLGISIESRISVALSHAVQPILLIALIVNASPVDANTLSNATGNSNAATTSATTAPSNNRQIAFITTTVAPQLLRSSAHNSFMASDFTTSIGYYEHICRSAGASANDFYWLGEAQYHAKNFSEAALSFSRSIELNATDSVRVRLVEAYLAAKQKPLAKQECQKALATVKNEYARNQLNALLKICDTEIKRKRGVDSNNGSIKTES